MSEFEGFPEGNPGFIQVPEPFFSDLLARIDDLAELKLSLYILWRFERLEGQFRYLRQKDLIQDAELIQLIEGCQTSLDQAVHSAVRRGFLLSADLDGEAYYFLNSPRGRAAVSAIQEGRWQPFDQPGGAAEPPVERPNIFSLYEQNMGPITPMIAEALIEAEDEYPVEWVEAAMRIAVEGNKRNWRYVSAILERWRREGRNDRQGKEARGDSEEDRQRYAGGQFADLIDN